MQRSMNADSTTQLPVSRSFEVLCHAIAFLGLGGVVLLGNIIGPLVVWLMKRSESASVDAHGKESLNFQISMTIWTLLCIPLCIVLIGFPLLFAAWITGIVLTIIGAVKASNGELYRYPLTIRFIK